MGDENPIRTLGDYSKPSHEGYRNNIELPVGNNVCEIDRVAGGKLRNKNADESYEIIENLTLYDHEGWNDTQEFTKPIKAISTLQGISKTPNRRLLEIEDQINFLLKGSRPTPIPTSTHIPQAYVDAARVRDYMAAYTKRIERFENAIFKQREEINDRMTEMFGLLKELTTSRAPEKVLIREEAKFPATKNVQRLFIGAQVGKQKGKTYNLSPRGPVYEAILRKKITRKEDIGGNFKIPCNIGGLKHMNALVNQGSDINVMPFSTYMKLSNKRPAETDIRLSLASHSYIYPLGIVEDILVEVVEYVYPVDFVILDIKEDEKRPFILGTPFLTTAKAIIKRHFKTLSLDELRSPDFNLFSDQEYSEEEEAKIIAETMEQYMSKTQADYGSGVARPKIEDSDNFELKGQFLKELQTNTFSGSDHEDAHEHIEKVLEIVDLFHIPNITIDQVMLRAFPMSLTGAIIRWLRNEPTGLITTWDGLKIKFLNKYCPPSLTEKKMEEINNF
ncbi:MAK10-like protein [Tanacetum coccineum]